MRGSYSWAVARLAILTLFVVPAMLLGESQAQRSASAPHSDLKSSSWLAAVELAAPVLTIHQSADPVVVAAPAPPVADAQQSLDVTAYAELQALLALHKELARELNRARRAQATSTNRVQG